MAERVALRGMISRMLMSKRTWLPDIVAHFDCLVSLTAANQEHSTKPDRVAALQDSDNEKRRSKPEWERVSFLIHATKGVALERVIWSVRMRSS